ncbi:hypothetical protein [Microbaculum sp. FT89]|uniref:hypothetical protein n=1 Tax=Microbaculum sp. FT89 TaxID=3447298 RepID=UPI003F532B60
MENMMQKAANLYQRPTDDELRELELEIGDPHHQQGLFMDIPEGADVVRIVNIYRYPLYPEEKAYCAKCRAYRHRDGFTAELDNGALVPLGSKCGSDLYGESWKNVAQRFHGELERKHLVLEFDRLGPRVRQTYSQLSSWSYGVEALEALLWDFRRYLPDLYEMLCKAARRPDRALVLEERVRDQAAELRYLERRGEPPRSPIYQSVEKPFATWAGAEAFIKYSHATFYGRAITALNDVVVASEDTQRYYSKVLRELKAGIVDAVERLTKIAASHQAIQQFFGAENRKRVVEWANRALGRKRYACTRDGIKDLETGQMIDLPDNLPDLDLYALSSLRYLSDPQERKKKQNAPF